MKRTFLVTIETSNTDVNDLIDNIKESLLNPADTGTPLDVRSVIVSRPSPSPSELRAPAHPSASGQQKQNEEPKP